MAAASTSSRRPARLTPVQATADDAAQCKAVAAARGYFSDPYIGCFVPSARRRSPLIHRGYYTRVACIDATIRRFLEAGGPTSQVVNMGAGVDSTFWRLAGGGTRARLFVELDLPAVTVRKASAISSSEQLQTVLRAGADAASLKVSDDSTGGVRVAAPGYHLAPCDLSLADAVLAELDRAGIDRAEPVLFVSECVLIYLPAEATSALLAAVASAFPRAAAAVYEQILPHDAFGRMMVSNLEDRGLALASFEAFPDCEAQAWRFVSAGFAACTAADMNVASASLLPAAELAASARVERLDEVEQWTLMQAHYCLAVAVKDGRAGERTAAKAKGKGWCSLGPCGGPLAAVLLPGLAAPAPRPHGEVDL